MGLDICLRRAYNALKQTAREQFPGSHGNGKNGKGVVQLRFCARLCRFFEKSEEFFMQTVSDFFGCHVFGESVMKQKLPKDVFKDVYAHS